MGDSGVGKSETAIELVKRGHRLIADDAVELRRISYKQILGTAPENIRHFIELRGIGIVNVARVFGIGSVRSSVEVEMVHPARTPGTAPKIYDRHRPGDRVHRHPRRQGAQDADPRHARP